MLNSIWLTLILLGMGVALWSDVRDASTNRYHNGEPAGVVFAARDSGGAERPASEPFQATVTPASSGGADAARSASFSAEIVPIDSSSGVIRISANDRFPPLWKEVMAAQRQTGTLSGRLTQMSWQRGGAGGTASLTLDEVRFVRLNAVTNDGIVRYAKTAVELAIGLIGIMSLWLGVMKIAERSGLVARVASLLKPLTTRLFPDVPPDHPAMGAMIMNISANMLGLANAATPLGLKAMEELNKLNTRLGTATDAMCTFLVINTSNVQLIPATVIALRAAAGAANPTDILGACIVATTVNTIVGVATVKLLAKFPVFKKQLPAGAEKA